MHKYFVPSSFVSFLFFFAFFRGCGRGAPANAAQKYPTTPGAPKWQYHFGAPRGCRVFSSRIWRGPMPHTSCCFMFLGFACWEAWGGRQRPLLLGLSCCAAMTSAGSQGCRGLRFLNPPELPVRPAMTAHVHNCTMLHTHRNSFTAIPLFVMVPCFSTKLQRSKFPNSDTHNP